MQLDPKPIREEPPQSEIDNTDLKPLEDMDLFTLQALIDIQLMGSMDFL